MLKDSPVWLSVFLSATVVYQGAQLVQPFLFKWLIDGFSEMNQLGVRHAIIGYIVALILTRLGLRVLMFADRKIVPKTVVAIDVFAIRRLLDQSYGYFSNASSGQTLAKVKNLAITFDRLFGSSQEWLRYVLFIPVTIGALAYQGTSAFLLGSSYFLFGVVFSWFAIKRIRPLEQRKTEARSRFIGAESDVITQAQTVLLFNGAAREARRLLQKGEEFFSAWYTRASAFQKITNTMTVASVLFEVGILLILYRGWQQGAVTVGDLALYQSLVYSMVKYVFQFIGKFSELQDAVVQAEEAMTLLQQTPDVVDVARAKKLNVSKGLVELDGVSFAYEGQAESIKEFSLKVKSGERLALVGRSGAGKSTLMKLLLRLYNVESGEIRIDGQPIHKVTQASLREAMSYVPQEPLLFHRSLKENIAYGKPDATDQQIIAAAKRAHCHEFISRLPDKYDSLVGERGVKLSGGERQRVAIARAILKNAPILLLDEATSALDPESEQLIQKAMEELMKGKTVIAIAHRLSTIRHMDRVIVLDQGSIADEGTHDALIARDTIYRDFWERQTEGYRG